jgi:3-phytase
MISPATILKHHAIVVAFVFSACSSSLKEDPGSSTKKIVPVVITDSTAVTNPVVVTDTVLHDTDDPAIWINPVDASQSLIIGTDKDEAGALYVFDLQGKMLRDKTVFGLKRPDNVDIEYGLMLKGKSVDIAVTTERLTHKLRIYSLPDMKPLDNGGITVFEGEMGDQFRDLMGIAMYKDPATKTIYAIVGRKNGPTDGTYLWQYKLEDAGNGTVKAVLARKFGMYSGKKEIEAIAVDDALGYVYYSDEGVGIRKYFADPAKGNKELALFGQHGFTQDHEGISIYAVSETEGYILVSDQQADQFIVFTREGFDHDPHNHQMVKIIRTATHESDGSDVTSLPLNDQFKNGLFVAMSANKTFQYYRWEDIAGDDLFRRNIK